MSKTTNILILISIFSIILSCSIAEGALTPPLPSTSSTLAQSTQTQTVQILREEMTSLEYHDLLYSIQTDISNGRFDNALTNYFSGLDSVSWNIN